MHRCYHAPTCRRLQMKPEDLHPMFAEAFNTRDLERMLALYEPEAKLLPGSGPLRSGTTQIREVLARFLESPRTIKIETVYALRMGDIALLRARWAMSPAPEHADKPVQPSYSAEIARLQPDGRWLYIIDSPFGGSVD